MRPKPLQLRNLLFPVLCALPLLATAQAYHCIPAVKYECHPEKCDRETENFQHAESFSYNERTGRLSACLWTNCYAGNAKVFRDAAEGTTVAIGRLRPLNKSLGYKPILVSLTYDSAGHFNAIWQYGSQSATFDLGKCEIRR